MDHKSWHWRKRSSNSKFDSFPKESSDEIHSTEKEIDLERALESLNAKLESVINENEAKGEILSTQTKMVEEAIEGQEKAEKEAKSLRQELDKALQQKIASNERISQLKTALKESIQQLSAFREEHDQRIREAVLKTSREFEKGQKRLEEKLVEKSKNHANLVLENAHLNKALVVNERLISDLSKRKSEAEMAFNTLMARLDLVEKENAFLKYEFRVLEKELDNRNEESEFSHRQYLESVKKITKLENECQRLRVLVRKRFPGPVAIAKMKDNMIQNSHDGKKIDFLISRLSDLEEENRILKEIIARKDNELSSSLTFCANSTSDFSILESQLEELSKGQQIPDFPTTKELSPKSNENETKSFGGSEMSLMDDFAEMEKLAIVAFDENRMDSNCKEILRVGKTQSNEKWLEDVLKLIFDQNHVSETSFDDLLEDIRIALTYMKSYNANEMKKEEPITISGYITWKSPNSSPRKDSLDEKVNYEKPAKGLKLGTENDKHEALLNKLRESEKTIGYLENEVESLKELKGEAEDQIVNQKLINEDLDTQLTVSKGKLNEVLQQVTALEVELEDKSDCYEELEGTCVELQLQLESVKKEVPKDSTDEDEKLIQTGWEITAASVKLAECQETIFSLGKQLKALASPSPSPNETSGFDKKLNERSSLRDRMLAEDSSEADETISLKKAAYKDVQNLPILHFENKAYLENKSILAIVPSDKRAVGIGFWRKLILKRKRGSNKKTFQLFTD